MPDRATRKEAATCFTPNKAKPLDDQASTPRESNDVPPQILAVMAVTTLATFGTLTSGYSLLF